MLGKRRRARRTPTVRKFLKWFGYARRGNYLTEQVRKCLKRTNCGQFQILRAHGSTAHYLVEDGLEGREGKADEPRLDPTPPSAWITLMPSHGAMRILCRLNRRPTLRGSCHSCRWMEGSHVIVSGESDGRQWESSAWKSIARILPGRRPCSESLDAGNPRLS